METKEKVCKEVSIETSTEKEKKNRRTRIIIGVAGGGLIATWIGVNSYRAGSLVGGLKMTGNQFVSGVKRVGDLFGKKKQTNERPQNRPEREQRSYERPQYRPGNGERKQQNV